MRIRPEYPEKLRNVLEHAARMANVLAGFEKEEPHAIWARGRVSELRAATLAAVRAWRDDTLGLDEAVGGMVRHLDAMHRLAVEHIGGSTRLACCGPHDAITSEGEDPTWPSRPVKPECETVDTTLKAAWVDGPEILARVREGLRAVEIHACAIERRIGHQCPGDDLRAFGREGLLDAARSYSEHRGIPFAGWAALRIRSAMIDGIRRWGGVSRGVLQQLRALDEAESDVAVTRPSSASWPTAGVVSVRPGSVERTVPDESLTPEELVAEREMTTAGTNAMAKLSPAERGILTGCYLEERTLEDAAQKLGHKRSWACKLRARALAVLREEVRE